MPHCPSVRVFVSAIFLLVASVCTAAEPPATDLDVLMAKVLEHRDQAWKRFHDYVLDERERVTVTGPGRAPLFGLDREYSWFVQDGYYVRSPVKADGVTIGEAERRRLEADWLQGERRREERAQRKQADTAAQRGATRAGENVPPAGGSETPTASPDEVTSLFKATTEPRFVSEAYFLKFRFEPGNYFFAGREQLAGREVLRVEYYPTNLYRDEGEHDADEERMARQLNKVALVTLWVDPEALQIVKYVFENVDFGFLPGRWLVRVDGARASMTMGQPVDGAWLPERIEAHVEMSLASGPFEMTYDRRFHDYRRAETSARVRAYAPVER